MVSTEGSAEFLRLRSFDSVTYSRSDHQGMNEGLRSGSEARLKCWGLLVPSVVGEDWRSGA